MMLLTPFWLDSNIFIEAKNRWYKFDRVPKFWTILSEEIESGNIRCPKQVIDELAGGKDQLAEYVKARRKGLCIMPSAKVQEEFRAIADHVNTKFTRPQAEEFLSVADPWLIAIAKASGGTVVTGELNLRTGKIRIPVICNVFSVPFTDTPGMLDHFDRPLY